MVRAAVLSRCLINERQSDKACAGFKGKQQWKNVHIGNNSCRGATYHQSHQPLSLISPSSDPLQQFQPLGSQAGPSSAGNHKSPVGGIASSTSQDVALPNLDATPWPSMSFPSLQLLQAPPEIPSGLPTGTSYTPDSVLGKRSSDAENVECPLPFLRDVASVTNCSLFLGSRPVPHSVLINTHIRWCWHDPSACCAVGP